MFNVTVMYYRFMDSCNAQKILVIDFTVLKRRRWYRRGKVTTFEYHISQHLVKQSLVYDSVNCSTIAWSNFRNSGWPEEVCGCPVCWFGRLCYCQFESLGIFCVCFENLDLF